MGSANFKSALANERDPKLRDLNSLTLENTKENQKGFQGAITPRKVERERRISEELRKVSFRDASDDFVYDKLDSDSKRRSFSGLSCAVSILSCSSQVSDIRSLPVFPSKPKIKIDKWHLTPSADSGSFRRSISGLRPPTIDIVSSPAGILRSPENILDKSSRSRRLEDVIAYELSKAEEEEEKRHVGEEDRADSERKREERDAAENVGYNKKPTAGLLLRERESSLPSPLNRTLRKEVQFKKAPEQADKRTEGEGLSASEERVKVVDGASKALGASSQVVEAWPAPVREGDRTAGGQAGRDLTGSQDSQEAMTADVQHEGMEEDHEQSPVMTSPTVQLRSPSAASSSKRRNLGWNDKTAQSLDYRPFYFFW
eukprot:758705-Hanusia_phi.AAC.3